MPVHMPDIQIGNDAIARLQQNFAGAAAAPTNPANYDTLVRLQHDCNTLVFLIDQLLGVDWLADAKLDYGPSPYTQPGQIDVFKEFLKLVFQKELDNSSKKGYKIIEFNLIETPPGSQIFRASAFLSPSAKPIGGPGGTGG